MNPDLKSLLPPVEAVDATPVEALPALVVHLAALQARAAARLAASSRQGDGTGGRGWLTVKDAAAYTRRSVTWLYRHQGQLGGKKAGRGVVFTAAGLDRWLAAQRSA